MEKAVVKKLDNGFKIAFVPHTGVKTVTLHLRGLAGSNYEESDEIGCAHITEHLSVENRLKASVIRKGGKVVAVTSRDEVLYMAKVLEEDLLVALKYLHEAFISKVEDESELNLQTEIIDKEIKRFTGNQEKLIGRLSYQILYPDQRIANFNTGTTSDLDKLNLEKIKHFKQKNYLSNNFCLTISGPRSIKKYLRKAVRIFSDIKSGDTKTVNLIQNEKKLLQNIVNKQSKLSHIKVDFYGCSLDNKNRVALTILAKLVDNFLKAEIKSNKGLAYNVGCESFSSINYGLFSSYCATNPENLIDVASILLGLKNHLSTILCKTNLELAKNEISADIMFGYEKTSFRAEFYSQFILAGVKKHNLDKELSLIKKVTLRDCKKFAESLFLQEPKVTAITAKKLGDQFSVLLSK